MISVEAGLPWRPMTGTCDEIREILVKLGLKITYDREDEDRCILNFVDEGAYRVAVREFGEDDAKWISTSTMIYDKRRRAIEANLVSYLTKFCELYLEGCCRDGDCLCRVHVDPEYPRIGVELKGGDIERFRGLVSDWLNCIR